MRGELGDELGGEEEVANEEDNKWGNKTREN